MRDKHVITCLVPIVYIFPEKLITNSSVMVLKINKAR